MITYMWTSWAGFEYLWQGNVILRLFFDWLWSPLGSFMRLMLWLWWGRLLLLLLIIVRILIGCVPHCRIVKLVGIKHMVSLTFHFVIRVTIKLASLVCNRNILSINHLTLRFNYENYHCHLVCVCLCLHLRQVVVCPEFRKWNRKAVAKRKYPSRAASAAVVALVDPSAQAKLRLQYRRFRRQCRRQ